jgi:hypothetical protein
MQAWPVAEAGQGEPPKALQSLPGFYADVRRNADVLEVLIAQMEEDRDVDIVLGKALGVLGQAERQSFWAGRGHNRIESP